MLVFGGRELKGDNNWMNSSYELKLRISASKEGKITKIEATASNLQPVPDALKTIVFENSSSS